MPDSASKAFDRVRSPLKSKSTRTNRIQTVTPMPTEVKQSSSRRRTQDHDADEDDDEDDDDDNYNSPAARELPSPQHPPTSQPIRSHTPGHLASKSQDRRRKPSELTIRQRSHSLATTAVASHSSSSKSSFIPPPTSKNPLIPASGPNSARSPHPNGDSVSDLPLRDRNDSSAAENSSGGTSRRPTNLRSTSAIASKPSVSGVAATAARQASGASNTPSASSGGPSSGGRARTPPKGSYTSFPPLIDPKTAPDVPAAPSSGMYWSRAPVSGAPHTSLRAHTTTLVGSNIFVFGGCDSRACFNELYVLDADAFHWSRPHSVGDIPAPLRAMTCTAVGKKLVIFGGGDGPAYYNDVYVLDTVNFRWTRPRIVGDRVPSKRRAHTACLYKNGIYVFGGGDGVRALNDVWRLDVSDTAKMSWKQISGPTPSSEVRSPGEPPAPQSRPKARGYHTANMVGSKLIIYGGSDGGECFNDVWVYDVESYTWRQVMIPTTFRRLSHTATICGSYLFVIGGHDGNEYSNDVLLLNLVTMSWDRRRVYGLPPSGRGYHGAVLYDSRIVMIGGFDGSEVFADVWSLELAVHSYYSQISHFTIDV